MKEFFKEVEEARVHAGDDGAAQEEEERAPRELKVGSNDSYARSLQRELDPHQSEIKRRREEEELADKLEHEKQ